MESSSQSIRDWFSVPVLPFDRYLLTYSDEDFTRQHRYVLLVQFISSCQVCIKSPPENKIQICSSQTILYCHFLEQPFVQGSLAWLVTINKHIFRVRFLPGESAVSLNKYSMGAHWISYKTSLQQAVLPEEIPA